MVGKRRKLLSDMCDGALADLRAALLKGEHAGTSCVATGAAPIVGVWHCHAQRGWQVCDAAFKTFCDESVPLAEMAGWVRSMVEAPPGWRHSWPPEAQEAASEGSRLL